MRFGHLLFECHLHGVGVANLYPKTEELKLIPTLRRRGGGEGEERGGGGGGGGEGGGGEGGVGGRGGG